MYLLVIINNYIFSQIKRNLFINKINLLFVGSTLGLVVISDYKIYDGFYTPLRSLYFLFYKFKNLLILDNLKEIIGSTVHNDSIKFFPTLLEYIFSFGFNYWNPRMSLLLGFLSWLVCYALFIKIIFRLFKFNELQKQIYSLLISICFFSSLFILSIKSL